MIVVSESLLTPVLLRYKHRENMDNGNHKNAKKSCVVSLEYILYTGCTKYKGLIPDIELCYLHGNASSGGHIGGPQLLATVENS